MFNILRIFILSIRTVLNCIFFPVISIIMILLLKIGYDISGLFIKHTWFLPKSIFSWFFSDYKFWNFAKILSGENLQLYCLYGSYVVLFLICFVNLFGITNLIIKILRSNTGVRTVMKREDYFKEKIVKNSNILEEIYIQKYKKEPKLKVKIIDSKIKNALIFSDNTIVLTTELLENSSDRELRGVLAHEWGHMHNGDTLYNQLNFTNTIVSNNVEAGVIGQILVWLMHFIGKIPLIGNVIILISFCLFGPFLVLIFIFALISSFLSIFESLISKKQEYRADEFALSLDAGEGLLDFLYEDMKEQENFWTIANLGGMFKSTMMTLYKTHPASSKRISKLEKLTHKDKGYEIENKPELNNKWL